MATSLGGARSSRRGRDTPACRARPGGRRAAGRPRRRSCGRRSGARRRAPARSSGALQRGGEGARPVGAAGVVGFAAFEPLGERAERALGAGLAGEGEGADVVVGVEPGQRARRRRRQGAAPGRGGSCRRPGRGRSYPCSRRRRRATITRPRTVSVRVHAAIGSKRASTSTPAASIRRPSSASPTRRGRRACARPGRGPAAGRARPPRRRARSRPAPRRRAGPACPRPIPWSLPGPAPPPRRAANSSVDCSGPVAPRTPDAGSLAA